MAVIKEKARISIKPTGMNRRLSVKPRRRLRTRGALLREIARLKSEEQRLREIEERYKALFDRSLYCVYIHDFKGRFIDANRAAFNLLGYTSDEIRSLDFAFVVDKSDLPFAYESMRETIRTGSQAKPNEFKLRRKDGKPVWVLAEAALIYREGIPFAIQGIAKDITTRKRTEDDLKASLKDKEILLREIHHRVKNNLQIISSLLDMKSMRASNPQMTEICKDAQAKIQTMALIHTHLYQGDNLARIHMGKYTRDLVAFLSQVYAEKSRSVKPDIKPSSLFLSITQAIPCAIVINEAVSNAFKHAFKKSQKGRIEIHLDKADNDTAVVRIRDDGRQLSKAIDLAQADTLGLKLMRNLVQDQLKGEIRVHQDHGTEVFFKFKIIREEHDHAQDLDR